MPRKENPGPLSAQQQQDLVSEGIDNFELPKSLVQKIAKSAIPENTKLQKEAILSLIKGSTVFINYLAATAHDVAQSKQHKSISASDVLKALELIDLGDLVEPLTAELQVYRDQGKPGQGGSAARRASTTSSAHRSVAPADDMTNGKQNAGTSKNKGKERADNNDNESISVGASISTAPALGSETLPPPFTSAPLVHHSISNHQGGGSPSVAPSVSDASQEISAQAPDAMDVDDDGREAPGEEGEKEDDDPEEQEDEQEEMQDIVALEAQEISEDTKGVEQRGPATEHKG